MKFLNLACLILVSLPSKLVVYGKNISTTTTSRKIRRVQIGEHRESSDTNDIGVRQRELKTSSDDVECTQDDTVKTTYDCSETIHIDDDFDFERDVYCIGSGQEPLFLVHGDNNHPTIDCHGHCIYGGEDAFHVYGTATFVDCCFISQEGDAIKVVEEGSSAGDTLTVIDSYIQGTGDAGIEIETEIAPYNLNVDKVEFKNCYNGIYGGGAGGTWNVEKMTWKGSNVNSDAAIYLRAPYDVSMVTIKDSKIEGAESAIYIYTNEHSELYVDKVDVKLVDRAVYLLNDVGKVTLKDSKFKNGSQGLDLSSTNFVNELILDDVEFCRFLSEDMSYMENVLNSHVKDVTCDDAYARGIRARIDVTADYCEKSCGLDDQFEYCKDATR